LYLALDSEVHLGLWAMQVANHATCRDKKQTQIRPENKGYLIEARDSKLRALHVSKFSMSTETRSRHSNKGYLMVAQDSMGVSA